MTTDELKELKGRVHFKYFLPQHGDDKNQIYNDRDSLSSLIDDEIVAQSITEVGIQHAIDWMRENVPWIQYNEESLNALTLSIIAFCRMKGETK